jgi:transcriptional regulator with XRE-family HTH domain
MDESVPPRRRGLHGRVRTVDALIGEQVRELREAAGYTQDELAQALAGVPCLGGAWRHRQTVGAAEGGTRHFTAVDLLGLSAFFGVPMAFLFEPFLRVHPELLEGEVEFGEMRVPTRQFHEFIEAQIPEAQHDDGVAMLEEPGRVSEAVMRRLVPRDEDRRWAKHVRAGVPPGEAYVRAREEHLSRPGRRRPGPTIVSSAEQEEWTAGPPSPWRTGTIRIRIKSGRPYTARDALEAEVIKYELVNKGLARRVRPPGKSRRGGS